MRYFFESKIEKKEKGYMIQIPFNIWEVCKQRDVIQADVVLDNAIIDCELIPRRRATTRSISRMRMRSRWIWERATRSCCM